MTYCTRAFENALICVGGALQQKIEQARNSVVGQNTLDSEVAKKQQSLTASW